jgi:hypothetical protein
VATIILTKHGSGRSFYRNYNSTILELSEEYQSTVIDINGVYFDDIDTFIAVFSNENANYLLINENQFDLNSNISMQYHCEQNSQDRSWIKIYHKDNLILDVNYKNNQEPFIDYIGGGGGEDWDVINIAWHLAGYINKVRENSNVVLFPNE